MLTAKQIEDEVDQWLMPNSMALALSCLSHQELAQVQAWANTVSYENVVGELVNCCDWILKETE